MKNILMLIFLSISLQTFSQVKKNYLKIGLQTGRTPYFFTPAYGYDVQFQLASRTDGFSTLIGLGHIINNENRTINIKGTSGTQTWDYDFKFPASERCFYAEANALITFGAKNKKKKKVKLKLGGGLTILTNRLSYYDNVIFGVGGILSYETTTLKQNTVMANIVSDNDIRLNDDLILNIRYTIRKNIIEQDPLKRKTYNSQYSSTSGTYNFKVLTSMLIGLGYQF